MDSYVIVIAKLAKILACYASQMRIPDTEADC